MTSFRLALLNIARKRASSAIAALAVAISVACGGVLLRLYELSGSRFATLAKGPDAIVGAKSGGIEILLGSLNLEGAYPGFLPLRLFESLRAQQTVKFEDGAVAQAAYLDEIVPFLFFANAGGAPVVATDERFLAAPRDDKPLREGRWGAGMAEAVAGSAAASALGLAAGKEIEARLWLEGDLGDSAAAAKPGAPAERATATATATEAASAAAATPASHRPGRAMRLKITGVLEPLGSAWDRGIYSNLATAREAMIARGAGGSALDGSIWGMDVLNYFLVYLKPGGMKPLVDLVNKRTVGQVVGVASEREKLERLTGSGRLLGLIVTSLIIALAGLCMLTLMLARFDAMATQIAVLRAIGYLRSEIAAWLLFEGAMIGLAGCALGAALDGALFPVFRELLGTALPEPGVVESALWQSWPVWVAALAAVVSAMFLPIWRMLRQDINASLKG